MHSGTACHDGDDGLYCRISLRRLGAALLLLLLLLQDAQASAAKTAKPDLRLSFDCFQISYVS